ncbi:hypothetical protein, partial [Saccharothrix sp. ST-888]|uniref:hypothetical protein n=1 Tax=Saccharothrix sp. ST-888 TaxID=1427391 RepID=UPI0005EC3D2E
VSAEQLSAAAPGAGDLFELDWVPVPTAAGTDLRPDTVTLPPAPATDPPAAAREIVHRALGTLQQRVAAASEGARLVVVPRGAVALDGVRDLAQAGTRGLVRVAADEHPDCLV